MFQNQFKDLILQFMEADIFLFQMILQAQLVLWSSSWEIGDWTRLDYSRLTLGWKGIIIMQLDPLEDLFSLHRGKREDIIKQG